MERGSKIERLGVKNIGEAAVAGGKTSHHAEMQS
jgi:hypothetical protein